MSFRHQLGVGVLVLAAGGILAWMALEVGALRGPGDTVDVRVRMPDAAGLGEGAVVSIAGVQVGRVTGLGLVGGQAEATVSIDAAADVRADAAFLVRARSLLGEKYLAIAPVDGSTAAPLRDGAVIEGVPAQVDVDEFIAQLSPLVDAVDPAALRAFSDAVTADPERAERMLADAEVAMRNLRAASERLPTLADDATSTLDSARRAAAQASVAIAEARPVLARAASATARLDALLQAVPPDQVPRLLTELQDAVRSGKAVIEHLDGSTSDLQDLLRKANAITREDLDRFALERGVYVRFLRPDLGDDGRYGSPDDPSPPRKRKKRRTRDAESP